MLETVVEWAQENKFFELRLWCEEGDNAAHCLYEKCGFKDSKRRNTTRDKVDKDLVEMIKVLE